jgi:hypothetical protein
VNAAGGCLVAIQHASKSSHHTLLWQTAVLCLCCRDASHSTAIRSDLVANWNKANIPGAWEGGCVVCGWPVMQWAVGEVDQLVAGHSWTVYAYSYLLSPWALVIGGRW